ncbi:coniferyl aldehyde dehydrogenase [Marinomonas epiphytica]
MTFKHNGEYLDTAFTRLKGLFESHPYPSYEQRQQLLTSLQQGLLQYEDELLDALNADYGNRRPEESRLIELLPTFSELKHAKKSLKQWMKPARRKTHISIQPSQAKVIHQPKGVIGVISPWNYPILLALGPLIGAIAAGNRVMLKVSEFCPATNQVLSRLLAESLGEDWVVLIEGEAQVANHFTQLAFDHILFTGSTLVGAKVMENAAKNLTPVTLELGGKSPLVITESANIQRVVSRALFGKILNAGQTCVAPDYILCHQSKKAELVSKLKEELAKLYPKGINSEDYTSMINERQLSRLKSYLAQAEELGVNCENILPQGPKEHDGKFALHLVHEPSNELQLMQDEIFGPILPILTYDTFDEALTHINQGQRPLAMYVFTQDKLEMKLSEERVHSGSLVFNHTLIQVAQVDLPFGGIGHSGMGAYHAQEGFQTFSHNKATLYKHGPDLLKRFLPPYRAWPHRLMKKIWRYL